MMELANHALQIATSALMRTHALNVPLDTVLLGELAHSALMKTVKFVIRSRDKLASNAIGNISWPLAVVNHAVMDATFAHLLMLVLPALNLIICKLMDHAHYTALKER